MLKTLASYMTLVRHRFERFRFSKMMQKVYKTPPVSVTPTADLLIVSQVHHKAVEMSLLSLKTFVRQMDSCDLELIDDGSLTEEDKRAYHEHLPGVSIIPIREVQLHGCPAGGTWERLSHVVARSVDRYVIQLDSDTLTFGTLDYIKQKIADNRSFLVGSPDYDSPVDVVAMSEIARSWNDTHIQGISESFLYRLTPDYIQHYARGCSGFTGFPKGGIRQQTMIDISKVMQEAVGKDNWARWGTEQVTSNILLSTFDDVEILPWPDYRNYGFPFTDSQANTELIHFIGTHRFANDFYRKQFELCIVKLCQEEAISSLTPVEE